MGSSSRSGKIAETDSLARLKGNREQRWICIKIIGVACISRCITPRRYRAVRWNLSLVWRGERPCTGRHRRDATALAVRQAHVAFCDISRWTFASAWNLFSTGCPCADPLPRKTPKEVPVYHVLARTRYRTPNRIINFNRTSGSA